MPFQREFEIAQKEYEKASFKYRDIMELNYLADTNITKDRPFARECIEKAERCAIEVGADVQLHFVYSSMIMIYYRDREVREHGLEDTIRACEKMIALAPAVIRSFRRMDATLKEVVKFTSDKPYVGAWEKLPNHAGYEQLAIIREKQGGIAEALNICLAAKEQGWFAISDKLDKRIEKLKKKLAKVTP